MLMEEGLNKVSFFSFRPHTKQMTANPKVSYLVSGVALSYEA